MLHYLYYSVTINESKENFKIVFFLFFCDENIVAPLPSSNFPSELICSGMDAFVCLDKSILMS